MAESRMDTGFHGFRKACEMGIMFGWLIQRLESSGCGTRTRSRDFARNPRRRAIDRRGRADPICEEKDRLALRTLLRTVVVNCTLRDYNGLHWITT